MRKEVRKMKTRKLLSVLMAVVMLFGCIGINAYAFDWPVELGQGVAKFRGLGTVSSVEIPVGADYAELAADAKFTVYYSAEKEENLLDIFSREEVGLLGIGDAYLAEGVLHLNLKGLDLDKEGYYYITVGGGSLKYEKDGVSYANSTATTEGVLYQYASLGIVDKLASIFDFIVGIVINLFRNGKTY